MEAGIPRDVQDDDGPAGDRLLIERAQRQANRPLGEIVEAEPIAGGRGELVPAAVEQANGGGLRGGHLHRGFGDGSEHLADAQRCVDGAGHLQEAGRIFATLLELGEEPRGHEADEVEERASDEDVLERLSHAVVERQEGCQEGGREGSHDAAEIAEEVACENDGDVVEVDEAAGAASIEVGKQGDQREQQAYDDACGYRGSVAPDSLHPKLHSTFVRRQKAAGDPLPRALTAFAGLWQEPAGAQRRCAKAGCGGEPRGRGGRNGGEALAGGNRRL